MKNNKGFTVIELAVSFCLVSVISIMLFQLIFSLKELYVSGDIKTTLLNKQGIMTKKIYDDLNSKTLNGITSCGVSCLTFEYNEGEINLLVDPAAGTITYDNYTLELSEGSEFGDLNFTFNNNVSTATTTNNSIFNLDIPIVSKFLNDDFGIHIIRLYQSSSLVINNNISYNAATIIAKGISLNIEKTTEEDATTALWTRIFHQENGTYYTTYENFLRSNNETYKSSLGSLEVFRSLTKKDIIVNEQKAIINSSTLTEKEKASELEELTANYQNGYFEFILDYPTINNLGTLVNYNQWIQTSDFTKNEDLAGSYVIDTIYNNTTCPWLVGIKYNSDKNGKSWANGCNLDYFSIGTRKESLLGPTAVVDETNLWVRIDDYLQKYSLSNVIY